MRTKAIFAGLAVAFIALPLVTSAATVNDLQSELNSLLAQIASLQVQGSASTSASSSTVVGSCPSFARSLTVGSTGTDVTSLQQFLVAQGDLHVSATGYFGSLTAAAVGKWQVQNGVTTYNSAGYGVFGPLSRSYFLRNCSGSQGGSTTTNTGVNFSASPTSGSAPLTVQFTATTPQGTTLPTTINYGDGTSGTLGVVPVCSSCNAESAGSHTYASAGIYTATLTSGMCSCPSNGICNCPNMMIVGTATVTVGFSSTGGSAINLSSSPISGQFPLTMQFTVTAPAGTTVGNTINFGDGTTGTLTTVQTCSNCTVQGTVTHVYPAAGTYNVSLTTGNCTCPANGICNCPNIMILATTTVTVGTPTTTANIQQLNAPGSVTLQTSGIAEIRNESFYFTLESLTASTATIQITPVGCWNSFPSDAPPKIVCMLAMLPIPPQTLSVGQAYTSNNYGIMLTQLNGANATFSVTASSTAQ